MSGAPVLVTGAGGFIGGAVARRLAAEGFPVRAGLRGPAAGPAGEGGVRRVACDLDAPEALGPALDGTGAVVHAAVGAPARMEAQLAALLAAMDRAGARRLALFSSVAVYGAREGLLDEDDPPAAPVDAYGAAKRGCEALARRWAEAPGRSAVALRPGVVYGRGSRFWIDDLAARIRAGGWGTFGAAGEGTAALVHVDDVAEAARLALDAPPGFAAFNIVGPDRPTWNGYFEAVAARLGAGPLRAVGPGELRARQAAALPAKLLARLGVPMPVALARAPGPGEMRLFGRRATHATGRAVAALGWAARVGLEDGLARSLPDRPSKMP